MAVRRNAPTERTKGFPADAATRGNSCADHPLHDSLRDHFQQLHLLEADLRAAQRQIEGLRHELRDALDRGEELLRQVVHKPPTKPC